MLRQAARRRIARPPLKVVGAARPAALFWQVVAEQNGVVAGRRGMRPFVDQLYDADMDCALKRVVAADQS